MDKQSYADFYERDQRLGPVTTFDGVDVYGKFNADLYNFSPSSVEPSVNYNRQTGRSDFDVYSSIFNNGTIELDFYVGGANKFDMYMNVNGLIAAAKDIVLYCEEDLGFEYEAVLSSYSSTETGIEWFSSVSLVFQAIRRMPLVSISKQNQHELKFENLGAVESGVRITMTSSTTLNDVLMILNESDLDNYNSIMIDSIQANYPLVIDGINGKVLENGVNAFSKTDIIDFPKVLPGVNTLKLTTLAQQDRYCDWKVEFYPIFVI